MGNSSKLPRIFFFFLLLLFAPLSCSQSQQSCDSSDLNALHGFVEGLQSSALGWSFNGSSSNCCNWVGISCDLGSALVKRVIGLDLSNKSLKGSVSTSLGGLDQLKLLDLSYNSLRGSVPVELFHLPHLELLDLSRNMLSGLIPAESNLPSIRLFNISFNSFNGTHPILARSSNLSVYDISSNSFSGAVGTGICNSSDSIHVLRFSVNIFSGNFPHGFGNCSSLTELLLDTNGLTGTLPDDLFTLSSLTQLNLQGNSLSGTVSNKIRNLSKLVYIDISSNNFSGVIPDVFDSLNELEFFSALSNELTGVLPPSLSNCSRLTTLSLRNNSLRDFPFFILRNSSGKGLQYNKVSSFPPSIILNNNKLVGSILPGFNGLVNLHVLDLSFNNISGTIPDLSSMSSLESLDLSHNHLTGAIPPSLSRLNFLSSFNVAYNNLTGQIPTGGQFSTFSRKDFQGNPDLCGIHSTSCTKNVSLTKNSCSIDEPNCYPKRDDDNNGTETMWLYLGMGLGFAIGSWSVYIVLLFGRTRRIAYFQMIDKLFDVTYVMVVLSWRRLNEKIGGQRPIS